MSTPLVTGLGDSSDALPPVQPSSGVNNDRRPHQGEYPIPEKREPTPGEWDDCDLFAILEGQNLRFDSRGQRLIDGVRGVRTKLDDLIKSQHLGKEQKEQLRQILAHLDERATVSEAFAFAKKWPGKMLHAEEEGVDINIMKLRESEGFTIVAPAGYVSTSLTVDSVLEFHRIAKRLNSLSEEDQERLAGFLCKKTADSGSEEKARQEMLAAFNAELGLKL